MTVGIPFRFRRLARALDDDRDALSALANGVDAGIEADRVLPLLDARATAAGVDGPRVAEWRMAARHTVARHLLLDDALAAIGAVLDDARVPWLPIKGMGLPHGAYSPDEYRPTSDIDVLIPEEAFAVAVESLASAGWRGAHAGGHRAAWLEDEGYNWQATSEEHRAFLELHHRLWGPVDPRLHPALVDRAAPDPARGRHARRLGPAHAYIVGACHLWNTAPPRPFLYLLDLERFARAATDEPAAFARRVCTTASEFDLQLFVARAARCAAGLWQGPHRIIADELHGELSTVERAVARRGSFDLPLGRLVLARLLSGRRSRSGWRAPLRRVWPHPALVEEVTPAAWSWPRRRAAFQLGLVRRRAPRPD